VVQNGVLLSQPFLDISSQVESASGERGLLGLAFDPNYSTNGKFYVDYIDTTLAHNTQIASFTVSPNNPNLANPSVTSILSIEQAPFSNHKAGWIGFRPGDPNNLYIATGDGGDANDPGNRAQSLSSDLGKVLRIDVEHPDLINHLNYSIPVGNPFAGGAPIDDKIWAYGLRNPFRNSFDRATGDFYIGDEGQDTREEIDLERTGSTAGARRKSLFATRPGSPTRCRLTLSTPSMNTCTERGRFKETRSPVAMSTAVV
jgi:glucose/arabinose dehydrogenase